MACDPRTNTTDYTRRAPVIEGAGAPAGELPAGLLNLPPFPAVAARLMHLTGEESDCLSRASALLRSDPAFSAEVLHLANSALFGFSAEVHSVQHAASLLGLGRIKMVAARAGLSAGLARGNSPVARRCWAHSVACAEIGHYLSGVSLLTPERAYTAGIMHDMGRLALLKAYAARYHQLLTEPVESGDECRRAERLLFGFDHCEVGAMLGRIWNLPPYFAQTAGSHHDIAAPELDLPGVVAMACRLADVLGYTAVPLAEAPDAAASMAAFPAEVRGAWARDRERLEQRIAARLGALDQ